MSEQRKWKTELKDMTQDCLEFTVFCIEALAERLHVSGDAVYEMLTKKTDVLDNYIIPEYEILHTQGREYIVDDLLDILRKQGVLS